MRQNIQQTVFVYPLDRREYEREREHLSAWVCPPQKPPHLHGKESWRARPDCGYWQQKRKKKLVFRKSSLAFISVKTAIREASGTDLDRANRIPSHFCLHDDYAPLRIIVTPFSFCNSISFCRLSRPSQLRLLPLLF